MDKFCDDSAIYWYIIALESIGVLLKLGRMRFRERA